MTEITSDQCKWCNGSGIDTEGIYLGNPYPCTECKGTGFEHGDKGRDLYFKKMDEEEKALIEKGVEI